MTALLPAKPKAICICWLLAVGCWLLAVGIIVNSLLIITNGRKAVGNIALFGKMSTAAYNFLRLRIGIMFPIFLKINQNGNIVPILIRQYLCH
ncbi:hypothetical protein CBG46_05075 [Actinobacillus succinogenes]|uniref:hypothetical protein n=1 Tax=Actinobacillus succinogenes TaxID=67854 RepID=UPI000BFEE038|nr:hypothetical protein [Actinobacillus succinogenes]PHI40092.1 hypothetical protein CBG46_05075 [Actinobacillus succinogenes]